MIEALFRPSSLVEIAVLAVTFYFILKFFRGTRGAGLLKGVIFLIVVGFVGFLYFAELMGLVHIKEMMKWIISGSTIALIVIFAPEMRRGLQRLAQSRILSPLLHEHSSAVIGEIISAVTKLSKNRIGALIAVERDVGLSEYIENAVKVDAKLTAELLETIFYPGSALHDGGVIVQHDRVAAAACLFPLTDDPGVTKSLGTRHRAAIGLSEETDAIVVVVSEETGRISICVEGKISGGFDPATLEKTLQDLYSQERRATQLPKGEPPTRSLGPKTESSENGSPVHCPQCSAGVQAEPGQSVQCPSCKAMFVAPAKEEHKK
jgi:diadenylate cyclase